MSYHSEIRRQLINHLNPGLTLKLPGKDKIQLLAQASARGGQITPNVHSTKKNAGIGLIVCFCPLSSLCYPLSFVKRINEY